MTASSRKAKLFFTDQYKDRHSRLRLALILGCTISAAVLGALVPALVPWVFPVFAAESTYWTSSGQVLAGLLMLLIISAGVLTIHSPPGKDVFNPLYLFLALYTVQYVLEPIDLFLNGPRHLGLASYHINLSLLYAILGLMAFLLGYHGGLGAKIATKIQRSRSGLDRFRTIVVGSIAYLAGIIAFLYIVLMALQGGISLETIPHVRREIFFGQMWIVEPIRIMVISSLVLFASFMGGKQAHGRPPFLVTIICLAPLVPFFFLGWRYDMLLLITGLLVIRHYLTKPLHFWEILPIGVMLVGGVVWYGIIRGGVMSFEDFRRSASWTSYLHEVAGRFQGYELFLLMLQGMPSILDFQLGKTMFVDPVLFLVPRILWPGKPITLGNDVFQAAFMPEVFSYSNPGLSIIAELYGNFSVLGIIVGMFLYGVFWKAVYSFLKAHDCSKSPGIVIIYAVLLSTLFESISGGVSSLMVNVFVYLVPLVLILKFIGRPALNYGANGRFLFQRLS